MNDNLDYNLLSEREIRYILRCNARNVQDFKDRQEQERKNFQQLCVMEGTTIDDVTTKQFEAQFFERMGVRIKFETEVKTLPDLDRAGKSVPGTGGRNDLIFFVHNEDVPKLALIRFHMGIRWWEDVNKVIYPIEIRSIASL